MLVNPHGEMSAGLRSPFGLLRRPLESSIVQSSWACKPHIQPEAVDAIPGWLQNTHVGPEARREAS